MTITINISGNGGAFGVGNISEEQYDYWILHEEKLLEAFHQNLDQSNIPSDAQIQEHYDAFDDIGSVYGLYEDSVQIQITDANEKVIFKGTYGEYFDFFNLDIFDDDSGEHTELYVPFMEDDWGYFVYWRNYQKGTFINCIISEQVFDPKKLSFSSCDLNGNETLITEVTYDGKALDIDPSGMVSTSVECSLHFNE